MVKLFITNFAALAFLLSCQSSHDNESVVVEVEEVGQKASNKFIETDSLVGVWESSSFQLKDGIKSWGPERKAIRLVVRKLHDREIGQRPVPYEFDGYEVRLYELINFDGQIDWYEVPDTANGWIDRSGPAKSIIFRLGPIGSHIALEANIVDGVMSLDTSAYTTNLRLVVE